MKGLVFEPFAPPPPVVPNRTDVACFVGMCEFRSDVLPNDLATWLDREGWVKAAGAEGEPKRPAAVYDVPLPIDSWKRFDRLFAWDERRFGDDGPVGATYLGAAVRSFFAQGGRKCYVVSLGPPVELKSEQPERDGWLEVCVPSATERGTDRADWHGLQHLFGLSEVSLVALPDLVELAGVHRMVRFGPADLPLVAPRFVECSENDPVRPLMREVLRLGAPRYNEAELARWNNVLRRAVRWLSLHRRDVQLLAGLPLPAPDAAAGYPLEFMHRSGWLIDNLSAPAGIASAFLQLGYPWLRMHYAGDLPANVEPGEGVMAGLLARNALIRGTFRSATALVLQDVQAVEPALSREAQWRVDERAPGVPLIDRVSLFDRTVEGWQMVSDVTMSNQTIYRQGGINRTIALVMRIARRIGEEYAFENSGERLWQRIVERFSNVLAALQGVGALAGRRPGDGYQVRCDRSTMTRQDMDAGRVIVEVLIQPAASIETIRLQLTLADNGQVSLETIGLEAA